MHDDRAIAIVAFWGKPDPEDEEDDRGQRSRSSTLGGLGCRGRSGSRRSFPSVGGGIEIAGREVVADASSATSLFGGVAAEAMGDGLPAAVAVLVRS